MSDKLPPKILVAEPDEVQSALICNTIERYWFDAVRVSNVEKIVINAIVERPNMAIISSHGDAGITSKIVNDIRKTPSLSKLPIILILDESALLENYDIGISNINEVIYRPFMATKLMNVVKSLLRRSQPVFQDKIIRYKNISMDLATYRVLYNNKAIHLGPTEFKILQLFVQSPETTYSREYIIEHVWGVGKVIEHRTVDVHINRLRTLMKQSNNEEFIKTVRASGYCLDISHSTD